MLDDVVIGIDEDASLAWAVEQIVGGRTLATLLAAEEPAGRGDRSRRAAHVLLRPMTRIPPYWHPYMIEDGSGLRRFVQGRASDLS
jgi:hypothetical protein